MSKSLRRRLVDTSALPKRSAGLVPMKRTLINSAIITVSDTRQAGDDLSGNKLAELLTLAGAEIRLRQNITDDLLHVRETLFTLTEREDINLIVTTGGTGF